MSLRSRTSWTILGQIIYIVSQFLILIALTRLSAVTAVGQFGLAAAIVTPIYWLSDLGLRTNKNTDASDTLTFANLFALRLITTLVGYAAIVVASFFFGDESTTRTVLLIFGAAKGIETLSDICYGVFERHGKMAQFAWSISFRGIGSLILFTLILASTESVGAAFLGQLIVWAGVFAAHDIRLARGLSRSEPQRIDWGRLWPTAIDSRHLAIARFLTALKTSMPRFIIERILGLEALGLFTALSYILQASTTLMTAISRSIIGHLATLNARNDMTGFRRIIRIYSGLTSIMSAAGLAVVWMAGEPLLVFVFGREFSGQEALLMWLLVTAALRALFVILQSGPLARREFRYVVRLQLANLVMTTVAVAFGTHFGGLNGAAAGLAVGALTQVFLIVTLFYGSADRR